MLSAELAWFGGDKEARAAVEGRVPLKRFSTPEEIAEFVVFVAVEVSYMTGRILSIDGGTTAGPAGS